MALAGHPGDESRRSHIVLPAASFATGIADTDVQLCPLSCAHAQPRARPFIGPILDPDAQ